MLTNDINKHLGLLVLAFGFILTIHSFAGCSGTGDPARECTSDAQCNSSAHCIDGYCVTETGSSSSSGSSGAPAIRKCAKSCMAAADCVISGSTLFDEDNWTCKDSACVYSGCNTTQECLDVPGTTNFECAMIPQLGRKDCRKTCTTAMDCVDANLGPAFDADNLVCTSGLCDYAGCNSTQECLDTFKDFPTECVVRPGSTIPQCHATCSTAADCAGKLPSNDIDNVACNGGFCESTGCNSDQECAATVPGNVCR